MTPEEKIFKVMSIINDKSVISPDGAILEYRAGDETYDITVQEEIMILNKLSHDGLIEVVENYSTEYV